MSSSSSSSSSSKKGKGKGKDPQPPQKKFVEVFEFHVSVLHVMEPEDRTFKKLLSDIKNGIIQRTTAEWEKGDRSKPMALDGKPALPRRAEAFVVAVTNRQGERVLYLYNWADLYNTAFYAKNCWYFFEDTDLSMLPPKEQFPYDEVRGKGMYELPLKSDYGELGRKEICLGPEAIDGYVHQLFNIRERLERSKKPKMSKEMYTELKKGALTFGAVVVSETSRFLELQDFMVESINLNIKVPKLYTQFFTNCAKLCKAFKAGEEFVLTVQGGEDVRVAADKVGQKIALMPGSL